MNMGGGTTELSVLASGGMVLNRLLKIGGEQFDMAIVGLVRHNLDFLIGRVTAEYLRRQFGIFTQETDAALTVSGRNLVSGVPQYYDIPISLVRAAMKEPLEACTEAIRTMLERTPPGVRKNIFESGIYLTGGIANLKGLYISGGKSRIACTVRSRTGVMCGSWPSDDRTRQTAI